MTKKDFQKKGSILFDYAGSDAYALDISEGRGVCLSGDPTVRSDLLAMLAKNSAIAGRSTVLISLHQLVPTIENNEERRSFIQRAEFVYVDWFEREFRNDGCPYSYHQIAEVEDFLSTRAKLGHPTYFSASKRWQQLAWYSRDFIGFMEPYVRDIVLG